MSPYTHVRIWPQGSSSSASSASTRSGGSGHSSHTQRTTLTSYSDTKPTITHYYDCDDDEIIVEPVADGDDQAVDPRASSETYASTVASQEPSSNPPILCPPMRQVCYEPDAMGTTPAEFAQLFPSTRRLLIQHDDTSPDGNLNLRVDTEMLLSRGQKLKLTLFHLRMYDLAERQFSLRRYHRQSGREVCNSRRKYLKPTAKPSRPNKKLGGALNIVSLKTLAVKRKPTKNPHEQEDDESDDDLGLFAAQADVKATIPTDTVRIEFSNYAQVELQLSDRGEEKLYQFEYWGERYTWRRNVFLDGSESVFSFELTNLTTNTCLAHITPDRLSPKQSRREAAQGSWIPPCSMRITEKNVSSDLGDVMVATGLIALVDDCIRRCWHETHRP